MRSLHFLEAIRCIAQFIILRRDKVYCAVYNSWKSMTSSLFLEAPFCAGSQSEGAVHVRACSSITSSLFLEAPFCAVQVRARLQFLEQIRFIAHNLLFTIPGRDKSFYFWWITSSQFLEDVFCEVQVRAIKQFL